jgi:TetR/AcrR family transcriptional regulator, transcriptional repressor for nem operon
MPSKGEQSRRKILNAAARLFNSKGFKATTINDLVAATGMQKGSLYFHFSSKEEIVREVLAEATESFLVFLDQSLTGNSPGAQIESFFRSALAKHQAAGFVGGCLFGNTALEMSDNDPEVAGQIGKVFDVWINRIAQVVSDAQQAGQVRDDIAAEALARHIIACIEGGIMLSRLKKKDQPMRDCLDTLRRTLTDPRIKASGSGQQAFSAPSPLNRLDIVRDDFFDTLGSKI